MATPGPRPERSEGRSPIVLLHGFAATSFTYRHWITPLSEHHQVMAVDLKGCGSAPKPRDGRYGPRDLAEAVVQMIHRRDLREVTLVGHSLGGAVALFVALSLHDRGELGRLSGLVSIAGAAYRQPLPPFATLSHLRWAGPVFRLIPKRPLMRSVLRSIVYDPRTVTAEQVAGYAAPIRSAEACHALLEIARQVLPPDLDEITPRYRELDVPALLLWGSHDRVVPMDVARRLVRELPRARLVVLEECGHLPPEEKPMESMGLIRDFIGALSPGDAVSGGKD